MRDPDEIGDYVLDLEREMARLRSDLGENPTLRDACELLQQWIDVADAEGNTEHSGLWEESEKFIEAARELVVPSPQPADECATCGHERRKHIYYEGACRPGFTCPKGCTHFVAVSPLTYAPKEK